MTVQTGMRERNAQLIGAFPLGPGSGVQVVQSPNNKDFPVKAVVSVTDLNSGLHQVVLNLDEFINLIRSGTDFLNEMARKQQEASQKVQDNSSLGVRTLD